MYRQEMKAKNSAAFFFPVTCFNSEGILSFLLLNSRCFQEKVNDISKNCRMDGRNHLVTFLYFHFPTDLSLYFPGCCKSLPFFSGLWRFNVHILSLETDRKSFGTFVSVLLKFKNSWGRNMVCNGFPTFLLEKTF